MGKHVPSAASTRDNGGMGPGTPRFRPSVAPSWLHRRRPATPPKPNCGAVPSLVLRTAAIAATRNGAYGEEPTIARFIDVRLRSLLSRGVPPRALEHAPVPGAARLRFADGTTLLVSGVVPGDVGKLAVALKWGPVKLSGFGTRQDGATCLSFASSGRGGVLHVLALGLDQPD